MRASGPVPSVALVALALLTAPAPADAARATDTVTSASTTTYRDAAGDVARSDGAGPFAAADVRASYVRDFSPSSPDSGTTAMQQDHLYFSSILGGARYGVFENMWASAHHSGPGASGPIRCVQSYAYFESDSTPDWVEELDTVGDSVNGWGNVGCYTSADFMYAAHYPTSAGQTLTAECLRVTRTSPTTLVLSADHGATSPLGGSACEALILSYDGSGDSAFHGTSPAPVEITFEFPARRGRGQRKG